MASGNRWSFTPTQGFVTGALVIAGIFVASCGGGLSNPAVLLLGLAIAILSPILIGMLGGGGNDLLVYGTAHVHQVSPLPNTGTTGRCEFELLVNARGIDGVPVRHRDAAVPVSKWPDVGATLPIRVSARNPRQLHILWEEVRTHREIAIENDSYPDYDLDSAFDDALGDETNDETNGVQADGDETYGDQTDSGQAAYVPDGHDLATEAGATGSGAGADVETFGSGLEAEGAQAEAQARTAVAPTPRRQRPSPFPRQDQEAQHPVTPRIQPSAGSPGAGDQDWERPPVVPLEEPGEPRPGD